MEIWQRFSFQSVNALSDRHFKARRLFAHKWGSGRQPAKWSHLQIICPNVTAWSGVQSFTTPINTSAPTLGSQSTANVETTSADMQVVLTDNGNAATTVKFYWGDNDRGTTASNWDSSITISNAPEGTNLRASLTGLTSGNTLLFPHLGNQHSEQRG